MHHSLSFFRARRGFLVKLLFADKRFQAEPALVFERDYKDINTLGFQTEKSSTFLTCHSSLLMSL